MNILFIIAGIFGIMLGFLGIYFEGFKPAFAFNIALGLAVVLNEINP